MPLAITVSLSLLQVFWGSAVMSTTGSIRKATDSFVTTSFKDQGEVLPSPASCPVLPTHRAFASADQEVHTIHPHRHTRRSTGKRERKRKCKSSYLGQACQKHPSVCAWVDTSILTGLPLSRFHLPGWQRAAAKHQTWQRGHHDGLPDPQSCLQKVTPGSHWACSDGRLQPVECESYTSVRKERCSWSP